MAFTTTIWQHHAAEGLSSVNWLVHESLFNLPHPPQSPATCHAAAPWAGASVQLERSSPHQCMFMPLAVLLLGPSLEASSRSMRARSYTWRMFPEVMSQSLKYDCITPCNSRFLASSSEACSHQTSHETCKVLSTKSLHQIIGKAHRCKHR